jgi:hypothetical protein
MNARYVPASQHRSGMRQKAPENANQRASLPLQDVYACTHKTLKLDSEALDDPDDWRSHCFPNRVAPLAAPFFKQMGLSVPTGFGLRKHLRKSGPSAQSCKAFVRHADMIGVNRNRKAMAIVELWVSWRVECARRVMFTSE